MNLGYEIWRWSSLVCCWTLLLSGNKNGFSWLFSFFFCVCLYLMIFLLFSEGSPPKKKNLPSLFLCFFNYLERISPKQTERRNPPSHVFCVTFYIPNRFNVWFILIPTCSDFLASCLCSFNLSVIFACSSGLFPYLAVRRRKLQQSCNRDFFFFYLLFKSLCYYYYFLKKLFLFS